MIREAEHEVFWTSRTNSENFVGSYFSYRCITQQPPQWLPREPLPRQRGYTSRVTTVGGAKKGCATYRLDRTTLQATCGLCAQPSKWKLCTTREGICVSDATGRESLDINTDTYTYKHTRHLVLRQGVITPTTH